MILEDKNARSLAERFVFNALKALVRSLVLYMLYLFVLGFLIQFESYVPGLRQTIENFVIIYISLGIFRDFVSGTVFQYFFDVAKALFVIGYLTLALNGGIVNLTYMNVALTVDLRLFLMAAILLSLLGLARAILQAINYANKKAELTFSYGF